MVYQSTIFIRLQVVPQTIRSPPYHVMQLYTMSQLVNRMTRSPKILSIYLQSMIQILLLRYLGQQITTIVQRLLSRRSHIGFNHPLQNQIIVMTSRIQNRSIMIMLYLVDLARMS